MSEPTLEQIQGFFDALTTGEPPGGFKLPDLPKLLKKQAFTVVYLLQARLGIVPDHYEMCGICNELFDSEQSGHILDGDTEMTEWYESLGITQNMLDAASGFFCSDECEGEFWVQFVEVKSLPLDN